MPERLFTIELNLHEGNLLLTALAECPFKVVFELIGKLNQQAHLYFAKTTNQTERRPFTLTEHELQLALQALGKLPYEHVHQLLISLNQQMAGQLNDESSKPCHTSPTVYADR